MFNMGVISMDWGDQRGLGDDQQELYVVQFCLNHPTSEDAPEIDWCMEKERQNLTASGRLECVRPLSPWQLLQK